MYYKKRVVFKLNDNIKTIATKILLVIMYNFVAKYKKAKVFSILYELTKNIFF